MDADRFGISQLHQLRGRVGRGGLPGLCLLVSHAEQGSPARERLDAVAATTDGFELSRVDLEQRREGDVLGRSQSGYRSTLQNLRVLRDEETIIEARAAAEALLDADADLSTHDLLRRRCHPDGGIGRGRVHREVLGCVDESRVDAASFRACDGSAEALAGWASFYSLGDDASVRAGRRWGRHGTRRHALGSKGHDADHRGRRRRAPDHRPLRTTHQADHRPGARGAVLQHRGVVRLPAGAALPGPLRRFGSRWPRGLVARRRGCHPGRVGPAYRPA